VFELHVKGQIVNFISPDVYKVEVAWVLKGRFLAKKTLVTVFIPLGVYSVRKVDAKRRLEVFCVRNLQDSTYFTSEQTVVE
jgi:hypothetical protein